jgi:hypothetical protein
MRRLSARLAVLAVALGSALPAHATQLLSFEFTGTVTDLMLHGGLFGPFGSPVVGDPFSGRFAYAVGPGNPDQAPGDSEVGRYTLSEFVVDGATAAFGDMSIVVQHAAPVPGLPPNPGVPGRDLLAVVVESPSYVGEIRLLLQAPYQAVFADDSLPTDLDLAAFTDLAVLAGLGSGAIPPQQPQADIGALTSLALISSVPVPAPTSPALLALAAAALLVVRRYSAAACRR